MAKRKIGPRRAVKATTRKRSVNAVPTSKPPRGAPASDQDPKRRLGKFSGAGEPARTGTRKTGAVGSTKRRAQTQKRK